VVEKVVRGTIVFPVIRVLALLTSACVGDKLVFTVAFAALVYKNHYVELNEKKDKRKPCLMS